MYSDARKLHLIDEVLKIDSDALLSKIELLLKESKDTEVKKGNFSDFVGIWTSEEADEIGRIIEESCETINPEDWK